MSDFDPDAKTDGPAPERRSRRARIGRLVVSAAVLAAGLGLGALGLMVLEQRAAAVSGPERVAPLPVETVTVRIEDGHEIRERYLGRLEAARSADLAFERAGRVEAVLVEEGDKAADGQPLARLDTALLQARRQGLLANLARAEAELKLARRTQARQGDLSSKGFASDQRFDEAETRAIALEAEIEGVKAELAGLDIEIAKSTLRAPFAGTVAARHVDPGAMLSAGQPAARLLETARPQARIGVAPDRAATLKIGTAYPLESSGRKLTGRLVSLTPDIAAGTRTVGALFDIVGPLPPEARFGDIVRLELVHETPGRGAWLPLSALQEGEKGLWSVFLLQTRGEGEGDGETAIARSAVEVLHVADGEAFVRGGLRTGDRVVASGVNRLSRGQRVSLAAAD